MSEVITVALVAGLAVLVIVAAILSYRESQREIVKGNTVTSDKAQLSRDAVAILAAIPDIAIVIDSDGSVLRAGAGAYAKGLISGGILMQSRLALLVEQTRNGGTTIKVDLSLPRSQTEDSPVLDFHVTISPLPGHRCLVLMEDLTRQRRIEQSRRDFTDNVSHELKTPVGTVRLLAETIAENADDSEAIRYFAPKLVKESDRLAALVKDIIDLSKLEAPDILPSPAKVNIDHVISGAVDRCTAAAKKAQIDISAPSETGYTLWGDEGLLLTAVTNLLDNAIRYSPPGRTVTISVDSDAEEFSLHVQDRGIGIGEEYLDRIFERFFRVDPARSRNTGGTGLGLSIVKHIVLGHGGTVSVSSALGVGSVFTITLPHGDEKTQ
ncbi:MAG: ATP-binding protein [Actinomycetaceae bacterium]|nr:ATP-binding protein [Actinomycetaceae bacterium]